MAWHHSVAFGLLAVAASSVASDAQPPPSPSVLSRLRDAPGSVVGFDAFTIQHRKDSKYCGGVAIVVRRVPGKPIAKRDEPLAAVFAIKFPTDLDFRTKRDASLKRFNGWVQTITTLGASARERYRDAVDPGNPDSRAIATARDAQIALRIASVLARAEIPFDVRTGEFAANKTDAFCTQMATLAEPLVARADAAIATLCPSVSAPRSPIGWWSTLCTP